MSSPVVQTVLVRDTELAAYVRDVRSTGGRVVRSAPTTDEGVPAYAVTATWRS